MEDEAMIEATGPTSHLAEIDAWAKGWSAAEGNKRQVWQTKSSKYEAYIYRDSAKELWLVDENERYVTKLADDTTLAELLTVCRVLGIPLEVEGPSE
jgi:hypothetical protein